MAGAIHLTLLALVTLSSCSNKKFTLITQEEKSRFLAQKSIFDPNVLDTVAGTITSAPLSEDSSPMAGAPNQTHSPHPSNEFILTTPTTAGTVASMPGGLGAPTGTVSSYPVQGHGTTQPFSTNTQLLVPPGQSLILVGSPQGILVTSTGLNSPQFLIAPNTAASIPLVVTVMPTPENGLIVSLVSSPPVPGPMTLVSFNNTLAVTSGSQTITVSINGNPPTTLLAPPQSPISVSLGYQQLIVNNVAPPGTPTTPNSVYTLPLNATGNPGSAQSNIPSPSPQQGVQPNPMEVGMNPMPLESDSQDSMPVQFVCSDRRTEANHGVNLANSEGPLTVIVGGLGLHTNRYEECNLTDKTIKEVLLNKRRLLLPRDCPEFRGTPFVLLEAKDKFGLPVSLSVDSLSSHDEESLLILYDNNEKERYGDLACEHTASPLFLQIGTESHLSLSSPTQGIDFDILGINSFPRPHQKKRISWFSNPNYLFLVNPTRQNRVEGINQMFGDNTMGPDGEFSEDGFMALAKYDRNADGIIDDRDPIYQNLRLWSDANGNGIAEPGELFYLGFLKVEAIDLMYDPNYFERDIYGNEIKYKSIVKMSDGSVRFIFDLWFRYL